MYIRQEKPADYGAVYQVIKEAFTNAEHSDGNESELAVSGSACACKEHGRLYPI